MKRDRNTPADQESEEDRGRAKRGKPGPTAPPATPEPDSQFRRGYPARGAAPRWRFKGWKAETPRSPQAPCLGPTRDWRQRSAGSWMAAPTAAACASPRASPATASVATGWT